MAEVVVKIGPSILDGESFGTILTLDASVSQSHSRTANVTSHPVEEGADVVDHVRSEPVTLSITGILSATPLGAETDPWSGRETDGWAVLEDVIQARQPVTIITSLRSYDNMVLTSLSTVRERGVRAIHPQIEAREIRIVQAATTALPPEQVKRTAQKATAPKPKEVGRQPTDAPTAVQESSALAKLLDLLQAQQPATGAP